MLCCYILEDILYGYEFLLGYVLFVLRFFLRIFLEKLECRFKLVKGRLRFRFGFKKESIVLRENF